MSRAASSQQNSQKTLAHADSTAAPATASPSYNYHTTTTLFIDTGLLLGCRLDCHKGNRRFEGPGLDHTKQQCHPNPRPRIRHGIVSLVLPTRSVRWPREGPIQVVPFRLSRRRCG